MKRFFDKLPPLTRDPAADARETHYKIAFLNTVFFLAGLVAFAMGFMRWHENVLLGIIDFGFAGLALALLLYLRRHKDKVEIISSLALTLSFVLFFAVFLLAPGNTTRTALFFLLSASAYFLKGRRAGFLWLVVILATILAVTLVLHIETAYTLLDIVTLCVYLVALFFILDSYESVQSDQKERLEQLNTQLEEKIRARTAELQQANLQLAQLNEELDGKVRERTRQLLEAQDALVRREKLVMLGQMAGSVGHELRNPLGVMSNAVFYLQTILADADSGVVEYLNMVRDEIARAERIVADLLDAARTEPPQLQTVDIEELIEQTLRKCGIPAAVTVRKDFPGKLPPALIDPLQMQQVLRNLVSNGIDAMPNGGELEVSATADTAARTVTVSVRDNGSGMTPEQMGKLFQPLFTTKARGIGLGLVVAKNVTEANGGRIDVHSEAGKGSVFSVTLPAAP